MRKGTLALAAAALLAGCSALRFAYENADTYLYYRATTRYLDVYAQQSDELRASLASLHAWHRRHELPAYARIAEEAAVRVGKGLSREDLVWGYDSVVAHAREMVRAAAEHTAPLLDRLTPQQVAYLEEGFAEDNREFASEHLRGSEEQRRKRRARRVEERLEDWVGNLSEAQIERVRQFSERAPLVDERRDSARRRLQAEVLELVRRGEARERLAERVVEWRRQGEPAYLAAREELYALLLDLDRMLSAEQRAHVQARLRRYAEDFSVLARKSAGQ